MFFTIVGAGCAPAPRADGTSQPVGTTPAPISTATTDLGSRLVYVSSHEPDPLLPALEAWAGGRGWELTRVTADTEWTSDPAVEIALGYEAEGFQPDGAAGWTAIVLEAEAVAPGAEVHTVGTPGERRDEASFLTGVLAGLVDRSGWVGLIGSTEGPHAAIDEAGFRAGIRYACPLCRIIEWAPTEVTGDALRANAIDVLFAIPGPGADAGLAVAQGVDLWVVWLETTPAALPAAQLAGGLAFNLVGPVLQALDAAAAGEAGSAWPYSVANEGIVLKDSNSMALSEGRRRVFDEARQGLADGSLVIGIDPVTGEEP